MYLSKTLQKAFFFIVLSMPFLLKAQSNYKPGYVVDLKGDTLKGFINYREWSSNPEQISFKANLQEGNSKEYDLASAKAFAVAGFEYYERHKVAVSMDSVGINSSGRKPDSNVATKTIFLRVVSSGAHVALYSYNDFLKRRFYLSEANQPDEPVELAYHSYYNYDSDQPNSLQYVTRYRTQLQYVAQKYNSGNSGLPSLIAGARYDEDDLTRVVAKINGDSNKSYKGQSTSGLRWFAGGAITYSTLKYQGAIILSDAPASNNIAPQLNAGIDIFPFKAVQKFYFRLEVDLTYHQYSFNHREPISTPVGATALLNVKQFNTIIAPQLVYNIYNMDKFKVFIDIGAAFNLSSFSHHQLEIKYDSFAPYVQDNYPDFHSLITFPIKAGVAIDKRIELFASYTPTGTISDGRFTAFSGVVTSYSAGVNFLFGTK